MLYILELSAEFFLGGLASRFGLLAQTKTDRHTHLVCYSPNTTGHD